MAKEKKVVEEVEVTEETPTEVEEKPKAESKKSEKVEYPEVSRTGKFQVVQVGVGYVVYNPEAARVTEIISLNQAEDIARDQNRAAHL